MNDISSVLNREIAQLTRRIEKLRSQREALEAALASIGAKGGAAMGSRVAPPSKGRRRGRRRRGANQEGVLKALKGGAPRRLTDVASATGLKLTAAGAVLRVLIARGLVAKGAKRGTYLLKGGSAKR